MFLLQAAYIFLNYPKLHVLIDIDIMKSNPFCSNKTTDPVWSYATYITKPISNEQNVKHANCLTLQSARPPLLCKQQVAATR